MIKQFVVKLPKITSETTTINVREDRDYLVSYIEGNSAIVELNGSIVFQINAMMFYRNGIKMPLLDEVDIYRCELKALNHVMKFLYGFEPSNFINANNNVKVIPHHMNREEN